MFLGMDYINYVTKWFVYLMELIKRMWIIFVIFIIIGLIIFQSTQPFVSSADKVTPVSIDSERLKQHVIRLSKGFYPRDEGHPDNLEKVADYLQNEFAQTSARIERQTYQVNNFDYHNVIASFGPEKGERIIVGAHYDTAGALPGADDNASGVAALIELAHLLNKTTLARRVDLVAYTLEEPPYFRTEYMGSAVHVKMLQKQNVQVRMMMALEMIGYFSDEPGSQYYPLPFMNWYYPTKGNYVAVVGNFFKGSDVRQLKQAMQGASDLPVYSINAPGFLPGVDLSDHYNFWQAGYNAVMITNTAFYRNREYHSPFDTEDRLDYIRMGKVVQSVYAAILQLTEDG